MAVVATFALVMLAACGSGAGEEEAHEQVTRVPVMSDAAAQATREAASGATPEAGGEAGEVAMEVTVVSNDIFFEPTELTIPANTNVKFILPNEGAAAHDFSIDELGIEEAIAPGETKEVIVNAPAGTYEFYCSVPGHKQAGMVGTLTVTEDARRRRPQAQRQKLARPRWHLQPRRLVRPLQSRGAAPLHTRRRDAGCSR